MRRVQNRSKPKSHAHVLGDRDLEMSPGGSSSAFNMWEVTEAANFELADCWGEGKLLEVSQEWPECVTTNLVHTRTSVGLRGLYSSCICHVTGVSEIAADTHPGYDTPKGSIALNFPHWERDCGR